jgi:hypothetical protein
MRIFRQAATGSALCSLCTEGKRPSVGQFCTLPKEDFLSLHPPRKAESANARRKIAPPVAMARNVVKVRAPLGKLAGESKLMRYLSRFALLAAATALTSPAVAAAPAASVPIPTLVKQVSIPHTTFKLKNGLTVIVHEDHKAPVAAIAFWYKVV